MTDYAFVFAPLPTIVSHQFYPRYFLVSTWINCMLLMLELFLAWQYFQHSTRPLIHRVGIGAIVTSDLICSLAICAKVYMTLLVQPFQPPTGFPDFALQTIAIILISTHTTASVAELFLCALYFNLIGAITCALTDSMITAALLYTFIRLDTKSTFRVSTHNLLQRLSVLCFSSGVAVASTTLLAMILLLNGKSAYPLFFYAQGRVYALTILANVAGGAPVSHTSTSATAAAPSTFTVVFRVNGSEGSRCDSENTSNVGTDVDSDVSLGTSRHGHGHATYKERSDDCESFHPHHVLHCPKLLRLIDTALLHWQEPDLEHRAAPTVPVQGCTKESDDSSSPAASSAKVRRHTSKSKRMVIRVVSTMLLIPMPYLDDEKAEADVFETSEPHGLKKHVLPAAVDTQAATQLARPA
ncbi:hypothetical protein B0H14DRAFT_3538626 [Mycena olivaceomarginata]|nr:hypothetical protein B0H14DRAFT_3538626 [Mycena olivaceomarginata]